MSVFTALPQDMLQWEINRFLDPLSRLQWNEVLKKDERVYKKFPADYAIKHQVKLAHASYHSFARDLQFSLGRLADGGWEDVHLPKALKLIKKYFAWFKDPKNHVVLMYVKGRKEIFVESMTLWTEHMEFYENLSAPEVDALRNEAQEVVALISAVPFIRHISPVGHKSAFAA